MGKLTVSMLDTLIKLSQHEGWVRGRYGRSAHAIERRGLVNRRFVMPDMIWEFRITPAGRRAIQEAERS